MSDIQLLAFGFNHTTAPVEVREKLYVSEEEIPSFLQELKDTCIRELVFLYTCNRMEVYICADDREKAMESLYRVFCNRFKIRPEYLSNYTYTLEDKEVFRHLFLVASGLDSMVIGEPQILGQVKDAYRIATTFNCTGFYLDKIFHKTFNVAKRIRTETKIGYNPVSISSMAVELSKKIFGDLKRKKILVIGAGEMCEIALRHFQKEGIADISVTNRTFANAKRLAEEIIGTPYPFEDIPLLLTEVDMVLSSTGASRPIIDKPLITTVMKKRKNKPLFLIDIAVPRDIEPDVNNIENVYLYDIDDLKDLSQKHLSDRMKEAEKAKKIIEEEVEKLSRAINQVDVAPLISHIVEKFEATRENELKKYIVKLKNVDDDTLKTIDILTRGIVNKLIHPYIAMIKENGNPAVLETMKKIFRFGEDDEEKLDNRKQGE
ncbi:MAG: glutamyl-tRNA reductase [Syntrophorhabdaceae bacterium]|nr:glutamyl-tRNA reductase [Syntrophorhabdaceae bacterium]